jgi:hypothetical protein
MKDTNMTEKETSNHINAPQSTDQLNWKTTVTWCEEAHQNGYSPQDEAEVLRDSLKQSIPYLRRSELRERLDDWITLAVEAIIFFGKQSKRKAEALSKEELEEELHEWVCLTLSAVQAGCSRKNQQTRHSGRTAQRRATPEAGFN